MQGPGWAQCELDHGFACSDCRRAQNSLPRKISFLTKADRWIFFCCDTFAVAAAFISSFGYRLVLTGAVIYGTIYGCCSVARVSSVGVLGFDPGGLVFKFKILVACEALRSSWRRWYSYEVSMGLAPSAG